MENTIWDKLIEYYDEKKKVIDHAKLIYHENGNTMPRYKYIYWFEIDAFKKEMAQKKHIPVNQLRNFGFLSTGSMEEERRKVNPKFVKETNKVHLGSLPKEISVQKYSLGKVQNLNPKYENIRKIFKKGVALTLVAASVFASYRHFTKPLPTSNIFTYHNPLGVTNVAKDVIVNYNKMENVMEKLANNDYSGLHKNDIIDYKNFLEKIATVNCDENIDFFRITMMNMFSNNMNDYSKYVLDRIDNLYNNIYVGNPVGKRYTYSKSNAQKYLVYVMSLITGGEKIYYYESTIKSQNVASISDAYEYNRMDKAKKLMILTQVKSFLQQNDVNFRELGYNIYSFDSTNFNKKEFLDKLENEINSITEQMCMECGSKHL